MTLLEKFLKNKAVIFQQLCCILEQQAKAGICKGMPWLEAFTGPWSPEILHLTGIPARMKRLAEYRGVWGS